MLSRCEGCPIASGLDCPAEWDWAGFCGHVAREQANPRHGDYWTRKLLKLAGTPRPPWPPPFPSRTSADGKIRVGLVVPVCYSGGADEWTRSLAVALDPARFSLRGLAILDGPGATDPVMVAKFAALIPVAMGREAARALASAVDVLVGWDLGDFPAELARDADHPPVVLVSHSPPQSDWGVRAMSRLEGVDHVAAVSPLALATITMDRRSEARVIWNAVDARRLVPRRTRPEVHAGWGIPPDADVTGYYGRFSEEKRTELLVGLARSLPEGHHVVAVGDGPLSAPLAVEASRIGLANLHILPGDPFAGDVLAGFDRLISLSDYESFGLSIAEAMWAGVPVLSSPTGLPSFAGVELARPIPFGADGPTLAGAVLDDLADTDGTRDRVARARAFATDRLSLARFGDEWSDYLASIATARPAPVTPAPNPRSMAPSDRDAILACPHRGEYGALVLLAEEQGCCGGGIARTSCSAQKGRRPGRVTLAECHECVLNRNKALV